MSLGKSLITKEEESKQGKANLADDVRVKQFHRYIKLGENRNRGRDKIKKAVHPDSGCTARGKSAQTNSHMASENWMD